MKAKRMESHKPGCRLIGLDVGERRIGVAVSDEKHVVALPECVIERRSVDEDVRDLSEIARAKDAGLFVVGLPLRLDGTHGVEAEGVAEFARRLAERSSRRSSQSGTRRGFRLNRHCSTATASVKWQPYSSTSTS